MVVTKPWCIHISPKRNIVEIIIVKNETAIEFKCLIKNINILINDKIKI